MLTRAPSSDTSAVDGVRAYWDGDSTLWSRVGNPFDAPSSFTSRTPVAPFPPRRSLRSSVADRRVTFYAGLPQGHELDGELFIGRDRFDETSGIVRSRLSPRWADLRYMVRPAGPLFTSPSSW